jgi:hypothetical protein
VRHILHTNRITNADILVKYLQEIGRQAVDLNQFGSEWGSMVGSSEHSNELLSFVKG